MTPKSSSPPPEIVRLENARQLRCRQRSIARRVAAGQERHLAAGALTPFSLAGRIPIAGAAQNAQRVLTSVLWRRLGLEGVVG